ncbi:hypothetical protein L7F22_066422 [Adiantum nelumboides]|nr:hypothetical protein [Adiantum nelumboides]
MIVFSKSEEEHRDHLTAIFNELRKNRLLINAKKSEFFLEEIHFLGHIVSKSGVRMDLAKVEATKSWPDLKTAHDIRSFLGLCSYYKRFIRHFAEIASPLHALTHKGATFKWTTKEITAFKHLKEKLTSDPVIIFPDLLKRFVVQCDACGNSLGAVHSCTNTYVLNLIVQYVGIDPYGPGCSSIGNGAFTENGPFRVYSTSGGLINNPFSWNKVSNMLFLDSPAGVGWSYSNTSGDLVTNDSLTARDNLLFLQSWFEAFPEYKGREFYIAGESYAGHYVPQLASLIVDYMAENGTSVINLIGIAIGNPLLDGLVDFPETHFFLWSHAITSDSTYKNVMANCNFSVLAVPNKACYAAYMEFEREISEYTDPYDILIDICLAPSMQQTHKLKLKRLRKHLQAFPKRLGDSSSPLDVCIDDELTSYMNLPEVQEAFHANSTGLSYRWSYCNEGSLFYDESAEDDSMLPVLSHILELGVSILVYSGDEDSVIPFGGTRRLVDQLASMNDLKTSIPYSAWFDGGQIGGWTQVYGPLSYATVRGAAHMVPYSSPVAVLNDDEGLRC